MSRLGEEGRSKKRNGCLTCLLINLVIIVIFIAALFIGGSIMFKTYVSPHIGGVTLGEALSLAGKVMFGKEAKKDYTEDDLDTFYTDLSQSLFLSDKTEEELEYELLTDDAKAALAADYVAAAESEEDTENEDGYTDGASAEEMPSYDNEAAKQHFHELSVEERYALLSDDVKAVVTSASVYGALAADEQAALRKSLGLKMYRISVRSLMEGFSSSDGSFSTDGAAERILTSLDFNFEMLRDYDINDPDAAANTRFNSITLEGKEVSAFINDIVSYLVSSPSSPVMKSMGDKVPSNVDLTQYVYVASVTIMNTPLATSGDEAVFDQKDTALGIMFNIKMRDIVLKVMESPDIANSLSGVPDFAKSIIPKLVPKNFSLGATVYPLAESEDGREMKVRFNNSKDKHAVTLSKIVNGIMNGDKEETGESETAETSFFGGINDKVVEVFKTINEKVKINFVPTRDKDGEMLKDSDGNTYSQMRIMTVQTLVSLIDSSGELSAHDVFTVLKCLYVADTKHPALALDAPMDALKAEVNVKYGVDTSFINFDDGFTSDTLNDLLEHMDLKNGVDFSRGNEEMRVRFSAEALASVMMNVMTKSSKGEESGEGASEEKSDSLLGGLDPGICEITIRKVSAEENIYALEIILSANLSDMIRNKVSSSENSLTSTMMTKLLPKSESYFGLKVYLSEYTEDGHVKHKVGSKISAEEGDTTYAAKLRINDFTYEQTSNVLSIFNKFLTKLGGGSDFDMTSITSSVETAMSDMFTSLTDNDLALNLRLFSQDAESGINGGFLLPSIYELLSDTVNKKGELDEPFTTDDAQEVLQLVYKADVDTEKTFEEAQSDDFVDEINKKYYIKFDSRLSAKNLFGGQDSGEEKSLNDKLSSSSIYFKPDNAELAAWREYFNDEEYTKPALYTDDASVANMRVALSGSEIAALVVKGGAFPEDMAASFGGVEILGASFLTEEGKTYLKFDLLCTFSKAASESEEKSINLNALFPDSMKISAKILLYAPSYPDEEEEGEHRFSSTLLVNDGNSGKIFSLLKALGGKELSEEEMSGKLSSSLRDIFTSLEKNIRLYYSDGGTAYTMTKKEKEENCIYLADVFTALIDTLKIKDEDGETLTDAEDLASRLRAYGEQISQDPNKETEAYTAWADALDLSLFSAADKEYLSVNIQDAYFMKNAPDLNNVYTNVGAEFSTFTTDGFRISDLYHYSDDPRSLKISGKALGALILGNATDSAKFSSSVSSESGMQADLVGLRLEYTDGKLKIHAAMKLSFGDDPMMPSYFFVQSVTTETVDGLIRTYETKVTINDLSVEETAKFFNNITSFMGDSVKFSLSDIENTINSSIANALENFTSSANVKVTYGTFTAADKSYYDGSIFDGTVRPTEGTSYTNEAYIAIPNVYSFLADALFKDDYAELRPENERTLQHMLNSMYEDDATLEETINVNKKPSDPDNTFSWAGVRKNAANNNVYLIYSDTKLAHILSDNMYGQTIDDGKISIDGLEQMIILRHVTGSDAEDSFIRTQRAYWAAKFGELNDAHDYLISTIKPKFNEAYSVAGSGENLLPTTLWFTVLIDLNDESASKGLLYDMNKIDRTTFENVYKASNNGNTFDIDSIAGELAVLINSQMAMIGGIGTETTYLSKTDDYRYCDDAYTYTEEASMNLKDFVEPYSCVGYIVIAAS